MRLTPKMQELTEKVIANMEGGSLLWEEPWFQGLGMINWVSRRPYRGMNVISLALGLEVLGCKVGQFLTYNQAEKAGGQVRKGSKGIPVLFFSMVEKKEGGKVKDRFPLMKTSIVFPVESVDGITPRETKKRELTPNALGDKIIGLCGATIKENGADTSCPAYYSPSEDVVSVPSRDLWKTDEGYYSTVFHELIHWTAKKERADRPHAYCGEGRAFEELVAELGAALLSSYVGFKYETQHSAYVKSWVSALKEKQDALYKAASLAQKAVDYILKSSGELKEEKPEEEEAKTA